MANREYVGDLAARVAQQVQDEHVEQVLEHPEEVVDQEDTMVAEARRTIFTKLEFKWRTSDAKILEQIRVSADLMYKDMYDIAQKAIDEIYLTVRAPKRDEEGQIERDSGGRVRWQTDSSGKHIEDWSRLTGQDIETCLFELSRIKLELAPQLNELLLEALFAKHVADDAFSDAFAELIDGTIPERNSHAARKARQDKYFSYFRFYLYSHADMFMKEMNNFARILERTRQWRIEDRKR